MEEHIEPEPAEGGWKGLGDQELYSSIRHKQNRNLKTVEQAKDRASESLVTWNCDEYKAKVAARILYSLCKGLVRIMH